MKDWERILYTSIINKRDKREYKNYKEIILLLYEMFSYFIYRELSVYAKKILRDSDSTDFCSIAL